MVFWVFLEGGWRGRGGSELPKILPSVAISLLYFSGSEVPVEIVQACCTALFPLCHDFCGGRTNGKILKSLLSAEFPPLFFSLICFPAILFQPVPDWYIYPVVLQAVLRSQFLFLFLSVISYQLIYSVTSERISSVIVWNARSVCQPYF